MHTIVDAEAALAAIVTLDAALVDAELTEAAPLAAADNIEVDTTPDAAATLVDAVVERDDTVLAAPDADVATVAASVLTVVEAVCASRQHCSGSGYVPMITQKYLLTQTLLQCGLLWIRWTSKKRRWPCLS